MTTCGPLLRSILRSLQRTVVAATILCVLPVLAVRPAKTQTYTVIHAFTGGADGGSPSASLTLAGAQTLYGTTGGGGGVEGDNCFPRTNGCGVVFKISHE